MSSQPVVLVVGAGVATGAAVARRFAKAGYVACVARRNVGKLADLVAQIEAEGGRAVAYELDSTQEDQMVAMVEAIERDVGPIEDNLQRRRDAQPHLLAPSFLRASSRSPTI